MFRPFGMWATPPVLCWSVGLPCWCLVTCMCKSHLQTRTSGSWLTKPLLLPKYTCCISSQNDVRKHVRWNQEFVRLTPKGDIPSHSRAHTCRQAVPPAAYHVCISVAALSNMPLWICAVLYMWHLSACLSVSPGRKGVGGSLLCGSSQRSEISKPTEGMSLWSLGYTY